MILVVEKKIIKHAYILCRFQKFHLDLHSEYRVFLTYQFYNIRHNFSHTLTYCTRAYVSSRLNNIDCSWPTHQKIYLQSLKRRKIKNQLEYTEKKTECSKIIAQF